jgi:hypothetical protein
MDEYKEQFFSDLEGAPRAAAKRLTRAIERELVEATINAPDWYFNYFIAVCTDSDYVLIRDTLYSARMARDLLWEDERSIDLEEFVTISQTYDFALCLFTPYWQLTYRRSLVDLFSTMDATANFPTVRRHLLGYYSLLQSTNLTNSVLSSLPLPPMLSPSHPTPLPSRLLTLSVLIRDTLVALTRLPFFVIPLLLHTPVYVMGRIGARLVEHEEETQAQNKAVFGLLSCMMIYPATFWALWAMLWYTGTGALVAAFTVWAFAYYHNRLINGTYI